MICFDTLPSGSQGSASRRCWFVGFYLVGATSPWEIYKSRHFVWSAVRTRLVVGARDVVFCCGSEKAMNALVAAVSPCTWPTLLPHAPHSRGVLGLLTSRETRAREAPAKCCRFVVRRALGLMVCGWFVFPWCKNRFKVASCCSHIARRRSIQAWITDEKMRKQNKKSTPHRHLARSYSSRGG